MFGVILIVHLHHVIVMSGRERLWHCTHVLMATGMVMMSVPTALVAVLNMAGGFVFTTAVVTLAGLLVRERARGHPIGALWLVAVIDLGAIVYMFAMMDVPPAVADHTAGGLVRRPAILEVLMCNPGRVVGVSELMGAIGEPQDRSEHVSRWVRRLARRLAVSPLFAPLVESVATAGYRYTQIGSPEQRPPDH